MKNCLLLLVGLLLSFVALSQTNYYSKSTGDLNTLGTWGTSTDGTGTAPTNFTTASRIYNIRNRATATISAAWTVSGAGSKVIVGDGSAACNFTIPSTRIFTGTADVSAAATLTILNTTIPTLGTLAASSTVDFGTGGQSIPAATYGNLTLSNASGTQLAAGAIVVNGALVTTSGGTFALGANQLTGSLTSVTNNGTITTSSIGNPAIPSGKTWSGTTGVVTFARSVGGQFIPAGTYKTLTCINTSGTNTAVGDLFVGTLLSVSTSTTLDMSTFILGGVLATVTNNGIISTSNTSATPFASPRTWGGTGTVRYAVTTGGQTIVGGTYAGLSCSNSSGTNTATEAVTVNTSLTTTAGGTFNMSTFALGGTLSTISNNGTISTSNTSATPFTTGKTWGGTGTVRYAVTTGGQTIVGGTYAGLSFLNTSGTNTAAAAVTVNTSLTTTAGGTLNMSTFALGGTLSTISNNGTISTSNTSTTPFTSGVTWGGTGTVRYAVTGGGQTIMSGTYNNLQLSNTSGTNTASGVLTTNGTLTVPAGGTLDMVTFALAGSGVPAISGTIRTQSTTNPGLPASKTWGGTVIFDRNGGNQNIPAGTFNNLTLGNALGITVAQGVLTVNGALVTTSGGTFNMTSLQLLGSLTSVTNNGTITTTSTANPAIPSGKNWSGTTGLVTFANAAGGQFIPAGTYKTLTCSNTSGTNTANGNLTISGTFTTSSLGGTFNLVTNTFTASTVVNDGTLQTQNTTATPLPPFSYSGIVDYNAAAGGQTIVNSTYSRLRFSNTSGTNTATNNLVVNTSLDVVNAGATLDLSTFTLGGTLTTITNNGTISTANTSATPFTSGVTWGGTGTVRYAVTTGGQTIMAGTYTNNLELSNTSGTNTASGVLTTNGTFTVPVGGTLNMVSFALAGSGVPAMSGTLRTQSTTNPGLPASKTWGGTVIFDGLFGFQDVPAGTFNNLTFSNTAGTTLARGPLTVNGALVTTSGGTLDMGANQLLGSLTTLTNNGTITTTSTFDPAIPSGKNWSGTTGLVTFANTTGGQFIPAGTYKTLTCSHFSGTNIAKGNLTISGVFTTSAAGGTMNLVTNTFTAGTVVNNGTLQTQNTSATPLPSGLTWGGTVEYNGTTGGQTIMVGNYATLTISNTSGINTAAGNLVVNTFLNLPNIGTTLNMSTSALSGTLTTITNNGIIATSNTSATPIATSKTWGGTGTVRYDVTAGGQTLVSGTYARLSLLNTSGTNTASGAVTVNTSLTTAAGGTLDMSTFALGGTLTTVTNNGVLSTSNTTATPLSSGVTWGGTGTVRYAVTTGGQSIASGTYTNNLELSNTSGTNTAGAGGNLITNGTLTVPAGGTLNMSTYSLSGTGVPAMNGIIRTQSADNPALPSGKTWGGTVIYDGVGSQNIPAGTFNNLTLSNASGIIAARGALTVNGALVTTSGGTLVMGANQLLGSLTSLTNNGTITTTSTANPAIPAGKTWSGTTGLVTFEATGGAQFIPAGTYKTLTCSNTSGTNTANGNLTVSGTFTTSSVGGTLNLVTNTFTAGSVVNTGTLQTQNTTATPLPSGLTWGGTVDYNAATGGQTIMAGTYATLRISNTSGTNTASGNLVVNAFLNLPNNGSTLNMSTSTLSGTLTTITNTGLISTSNTSATPIASGKTWGGNGTVRYDVTTGGQTVVSGTYARLVFLNTSGINTASSALNVNLSINTTAGGTLDMSTFALGGALSFVSNNGIISTANTSATPIPTGLNWGGFGIVRYALTTGAQTIMSGTYNNLELSNTSGTNTASGDITVNGLLTTTAGGTFSFPNTTNELFGGAGMTVNHSGTLTTQSTGNPSIPTGKTWGGTVIFGRTAGGQNIPAGTFNNLTLSNNSGTQSAQGALTVNGALVTTNGGTLAMGANQLSGTLTSVTNNGTITTTCTINPAIPTGENWSGTTGLVTFANTTGGQFIPAGTYKTLTCINTSGTNTANGNLTVSGTFTTSSAGGTLNLVTNTFTAGTVVNTGTLQTQNTTATPFTSGLTWGGTVDYNAATGGQTIMAGTYATLRISNTSGINTASGNLVVNTFLNLPNNGSTLDMSTATLSGTLTTITNTGLISTSNTSATPIAAGKTWGGTGTVRYDVTTGGQTLVSGTYARLIFMNTSGISSASGAVIANISIRTTGGGTLDMSTFTLGGALSLIYNVGTISTSNTSATPIPTGLTWGGTIRYAVTTGGQTIMAGTYNNLELSNTSGTNTASGNITTNGTLTVPAGGTLNMATRTLAGSGVPAMSGTLRTQSTADPALPSGKTWGGTVIFDNTFAGQFIPAGTFNNLALNNSLGTQTARGALTVDGTLTNSVTLDMGANQLSGSLTSVTNSGTINTTSTANPAIPSGKTWGGTVNFQNTTGGQFIPAGTYTTLTCSNTSGTNTANGNLTISSVFTTSSAGGTMDMGTNTFTAASGVTNNGTLKTQNTSATPLPTGLTWGGTVNYNATTGGQTIMAGNYTNLTLNNTSGTNTASGNISVSSALTTGTGTSVFDMSTFRLSGTLSPISGSGTLKTQSTSATPIAASKTWPQTIEYNRAAGGQTIVSGTYNGGLTNSNTSGVNNVDGAASITVNGALTLSALSNLSDNSRTITVTGNIAGTGTHTSVTTGSISMTGAGGTISSVTLGNLTLNNAAGFSLSGSPQINGTLTFTSGRLDIANNNLTFGPSAPSVAGTPASTKMIVTSGTGEVRKRYSGLGTFTFPIGDATPNYSPFTVNLTGGTPGGSAYVGVRVDDAKHPNNASTTDYLNRFWAVNISDVTSPQYSISCIYVDADIVGTEASIATASYGGSLPWVNLGAVNTAANTINASSLSGTNVAYTGIRNVVPTVTVTPTSATICSGNSVVLTASGAGNPTLTYTWSPATGLSATTGTSVTASPTASGTPSVVVYTVTITDGNGASASTTTTLTVNPLPTVSAGSDVAICTGTSTGLTATGAATYTWSPATDLSATTGASVTANPTSTNTYTVTGTGSNGCINTSSVTVTVNALPTVAAGSGIAICIGTSTGLTATGAATYTWSPATDLSATTGATVTANPTSNITYTVTGTDGNGCINTASKTVTANSLPTVAAGSDVAICTGTSTGLTATGAVTYTWSPATDLSATTGATVTANPTSNITYTVTGTDGNGCINTASQTVTVNALPAVSAGSDVAICNGFSTDLTGTGAVTYSWSPATALSATIGAAFTANPSSTTTYTVTGTGSNGCTNTASVTVTVNALPVVDTIAGTLSVCKDATTALSNATGGGVWTSSNTAVATISATGIVTGVDAGTTTVSYTVTNGFGCVTRVTKVVTVNPLPVIISVSGIFTTCENADLELTASIPSGTWTSSNIAIANIDTFTGIVTPVNVGTALMSYQVTATGCMATREITMIEAPTAISGVTDMCPGATATLTCTYPGGTWSAFNPAVISINPTTGAMTAVIVAYFGYSETAIRYTIPNGCFRVVFPKVYSIPAPIYGGLTSLCVGETTTFLSGSLGNTWSSNNTGIATITSGGVITAQAPGVATISYTGSFGCANTRTLTVNPALSPSVGSATVCTGTTTLYTNAATGGTWTSSNISKATVNLTSGLVSASNAGTTTLSYRAPSGCYITNVITVNTTPSLITGTRSVCIGATTTLGSTPAAGTWSSSADGIALVGSTTGIVSGVASGTAIVTYTSSGCTKTSIVTVNALPASISGAGVACTGGTTALTNVSGTWTSSNTGIATVNYLGTVTGVSAGNAMITFRNANSCSTTKEVTINPLPSTIVVPTGLCLGSTGTFTATPSGGTWASVSPSVFSVNSVSGAMTALIANYTSNSLGTVSYTLPTGCVRTGLVTVNRQPGSIYGGTGKVCTGATTTQLSSATGCTWSSATPSVATISPTGVVTGVSAGNTVVSYTSAVGCAATRVITVNATPDVITGATTVLMGQTTTLANTTSGGTWSSSVPSRATIGSASGVVTGMSIGTTNITYMMSTGCFVTRAVNIATARGTDETVKEVVVTDVKLYPNPTTGIFTVSTPIAGTISVYSIDGRELMQQKVTSGVSSLSLPNNIPAGFYTCMFTGTDGGATIIRLVYEPR